MIFSCLKALISKDSKVCQSSLIPDFFIRFFSKYPDKPIRSWQLWPPQMPRTSKRAILLKEYKAKGCIKKAYICFRPDEEDVLKINLHCATVIFL